MSQWHSVLQLAPSLSNGFHEINKIGPYVPREEEQELWDKSGRSSTDDGGEGKGRTDERKILNNTAAPVC